MATIPAPGHSRARAIDVGTIKQHMLAQHTK